MCIFNRTRQTAFDWHVSPRKMWFSELKCRAEERNVFFAVAADCSLYEFQLDFWSQSKKMRVEFISTKITRGLVWKTPGMLRGSCETE